MHVRVLASWPLIRADAESIIEHAQCLDLQLSEPNVYTASLRTGQVQDALKRKITKDGLLTQPMLFFQISGSGYITLGLRLHAMGMLLCN